MQKSNNVKLGRSIEDILAANQFDALGFFNEKSEPQYLQISIDKVMVNDLLASRTILKDEMAQLVTSLKEYGMITPVLVRRNESQSYDLITGVKRYLAAKELQETTIPAVVLTMDFDHYLDLMIRESIQNEKLNPIEKANSYLYMVNLLHLSQTEIAKKVNRSRPYVTNHLRLLSLPKKIQKDLMNLQLSFGQARPLINLKKEDQLALAKRAIDEKLSARDIEGIAKDLLNINGKESNQSHLCKNLATKLDCSVKIRKNRLILSTKSPEELKRVLDLLVHES